MLPRDSSHNPNVRFLLLSQISQHPTAQNAALHTQFTDFLYNYSQTSRRSEQLKLFATDNLIAHTAAITHYSLLLVCDDRGLMLYIYI